MKRGLSNGFTLVELLVVIAIIGLLATFAVTQLSGARDKARIAANLQFESSMHHLLAADAAVIWNVDEGSGATTMDTSGNGNSATLTNGPVWRCADTNRDYTPSGTGCSVEFDGVDDYISSTVSNIGDGTISFWALIKSGTADGDLLVGRRTPGCYGSALYAYPTQSSIVVYNAGPETIIGPYTPNAWVHIAATRSNSGTVAKFYIDGKLKKTNNYSLNLNHLMTSIGASCSGANSFAGLIDSVRAYSVPLTSEEIHQMYAEGLPRHLAASQK